MKLFFTKKDRKIANLEAKIKNRDRLIGDMERTIERFRAVINSLEDENKELREKAFEGAKKEVKKGKVGRPKKNATNK